MPYAASPGRIPDLTHVRLTAGAWLLLGAGLALLGVILMRPAWIVTPVGDPFGAAAAGALWALLPGCRLTARADPGKWARAYLVVSGSGVAGGLLCLSIQQPSWAQTGAAALMGVACGGCLRLSLALVLALLPPRRPAAIMSLCGASFGLGGVLGSLAGAWVAGPAAWGDPVLLAAAVVPLLLVAASIRAGRVKFAVDAASRDAEWVAPSVRPRSILLSASLLLQALAGGLAASWLTSLLSRRAGFSLVEGAAAMALFWLGLAFGWALAARQPRLCSSLRPLAGLLALALSGGGSLLFANVAALAVAGAPILGLASGSLFALTLRLGHWPGTLGRSLVVTCSVQAALVAALAGSWGIVALGGVLGGSTPVWAILACMIGAIGALLLLVVDYRISGDAVVV